MKAFTKRQRAKVIKRKIRRFLIKAEGVMFRIMLSLTISFGISSLLFLTCDKEFDVIVKTLFFTVLFVITVLMYIEVTILGETLALRRSKLYNK